MSVEAALKPSPNTTRIVCKRKDVVFVGFSLSEGGPGYCGVFSVSITACCMLYWRLLSPQIDKLRFSPERQIPKSISIGVGSKTSKVEICHHLYIETTA